MLLLSPYSGISDSCIAQNNFHSDSQSEYFRYMKPRDCRGPVETAGTGKRFTRLGGYGFRAVASALWYHPYRRQSWGGTIMCTPTRAGHDLAGILALKTPYDDGTLHVVLSPMEFMGHLAALVPKPRVNLTRAYSMT